MSFYQHGMSLKALLENPDLLAPPKQLENADKKKNGSLDVDNSLFLGQSAFLGPQLWDKTYDEADLKLEFMDLDEFLNENELVEKFTSGSPPPTLLQTPPLKQPKLQQPLTLQLPNSPPTVNLPSPHHPLTPPTPTLPSPHHTHSPSAATPPLPAINPNMMTQHSPAQQSAPSPAPTLVLPPNGQTQQQVEVLASGGSVEELEEEEEFEEAHQGIKTVLTPGGQCDEWQDGGVTVQPQDLMLASLPGEDFDPSNRRFTADELRPQPLIKKSRKVFVPNELKDDKYWARRRKNNVAAQRSRDARRTKENQIAMRAMFLEQQSEGLAKELEKAKKENENLRMRLAKYEPEVMNE